MGELLLFVHLSPGATMTDQLGLDCAAEEAGSAGSLAEPASLHWFEEWRDTRRRSGPPR